MGRRALFHLWLDIAFLPIYSWILHALIWIYSEGGLQHTTLYKFLLIFDDVLPPVSDANSEAHLI